MNCAAPKKTRTQLDVSTIKMPVVDLTQWDVILVNSSAGKDSQCMLDVVTEQARAQGVADRIVVVHADLGRVEWKGTRELAEEQAKHYGHRFEVVVRAQGDLIDRIRQRGSFPGSMTRYCTAELKRNQVQRLMTSLTDAFHARGAAGGDATLEGVRQQLRKPDATRPCRILNCMGLRALESSKRAKKEPFRQNTTSNGRRDVWDWLPIFNFTLEQVWARIKASGVKHHYAYDLGMPRLSCVFCVFAPPPALVLAGKHNRALLAQYVELEKEINHTFTADFSIASIAEKVDAGVDMGPINTWEM